MKPLLSASSSKKAELVQEAATETGRIRVAAAEPGEERTEEQDEIELIQEAAAELDEERARGAAARPEDTKRPSASKRPHTELIQEAATERDEESTHEAAAEHKIDQEAERVQEAAAEVELIREVAAEHDECTWRSPPRLSSSREQPAELDEERACEAAAKPGLRQEAELSQEAAAAI